ncbi:OmpW/AlkL family protein [Marinobacter zhejiangensis]|uniref:Outer membrane protein n=1 Tax=Marinobacter zhejiangensis TaxID=488535 RepID=A0A1I4LI38_9GAMM|nr:OmpW family outer membrane protein [Marinobacter zhejiangensis]SFL90694.1 outer membrane protein [Marinobacter zhejiangensis]
MSKFMKTSTLAGCLLMTGVAQAHEAGDFLLRVGAALVDPDTSSGNVMLGGNGVGDGNWQVDVDSDTQLGITATYMLTDHIGVGLLGATPFSHDINAAGSIDGAGKLGETKHLPPTLTAQFYPLDSTSQFQPYVGIGINYTNFFEEKTTATLTGAVDSALGGGVIDGTALRLDDSFGIAAELGLDVKLTDRIGLNASMWWIDIDTTAKIDAIQNGQTIGTAEVDVDIDPMAYMVGLSYTF